MTRVSDNLNAVHDQIALACARYGRDATNVRLMGVSKRQPMSRIVEAWEAGLRLFGENRVQEMRDKWAVSLADAEVHLIGQLQSNKVKDAARLFSCVQSVDREKIARLLNERAQSVAPRGFEVFVEVNTSGEQSKSGVADETELFRLCDAILELPHLRMRGLMTVGPLSADERRIRAAFSSLRTMSERAVDRFSLPDNLELSMGMSDDFSYAIAEGSTMIRVGTAIFGERGSL